MVVVNLSCEGGLARERVWTHSETRPEDLLQGLAAGSREKGEARHLRGSQDGKTMAAGGQSSLKVICIK